MELSTATSLIENGITPATSQQWADLGTGKGLFTRALTNLIGSGSTIHAIDKDASILTPTGDGNNITVNSIKLDFTNGLGNISNLDGILMANSLHFVHDKISLLKKLSGHLKPGGRFIIIEYNTDQPNTWVPYPISLSKLTALVKSNDLGSIEKIGEANSNYQRGGMYSVLIYLV